MYILNGQKNVYMFALILMNDGKKPFNGCISPDFAQFLQKIGVSEISR
jgi:hypothetical protein